MWCQKLQVIMSATVWCTYEETAAPRVTCETVNELPSELCWATCYGLKGPEVKLFKASSILCIAVTAYSSGVTVHVCDVIHLASSPRCPVTRSTHKLFPCKQQPSIQVMPFQPYNCLYHEKHNDLKSVDETGT